MRAIYFCLLFLFSFASSAYAQVDINTATETELTKLNGVGPATAAKIVAFRDLNGPFKTCDELRKVKGIGPKKLESITPDCITGEGQPTTNPGIKTPTTPVQKSSGNGVDINAASLKELESLNGVGPSTAKKIVEFREKNGLFKTCDDLRKVKGIGPKKMEQIKPQCKVVLPSEK